MADKGNLEENRTKDTDFEPTYCGSLLKELDKQRRNGILCDLSIFIHDSCFNLHSCVIRAKCVNYDALMSRSQQSEGIGQSHHFVLFHDWSVKAFQLVTDYIYSGVLRLDSDSISNVHKIADYLGVVELQEACRKITSTKVRLSRLEITGNTVHLNQAKSPLKAKIKVERDTPEYEKAASIWSEQAYEPSGTESEDNFVGNDDDSLPEAELKDEGGNDWKDKAGKKTTVKIPKRKPKKKKGSVRRTSRTKKKSKVKLKVDPRLSNKTMDVFHECTVCKQRFISGQGLTTHVRKLHIPVEFKCVYCKFETKQSEVFYQHVINIHKDPQPFRCPEINCKSKISRFRDLDKHVNSHSKGFQVYHCASCNEQFQDMKVYSEHMKNEHQWEMHTCKICEKSFNEEYGLTWHMKIHYSSIIFSCKIQKCGVEASTEEELKTHQEEKHGKKVNKISTEVGGNEDVEKEGGGEENGTKDGEEKSTENANEMDASQENESDNYEMEELDKDDPIHAIFGPRDKLKRNNCADCDEDYRTKKGFQEHLDKYHIRQFECVKCQKRYTTEIWLTKHVREKHAPAIFECLQCEYETNTQVAFFNHAQQVHGDNKPFQCPELDCISKLKHWRDVTRHITNHTKGGQKKGADVELYLCNGCPEKFEKFAIYVEHLKEKHKMQIYPCSVCGKSFRNKSGLSWHNKDHFITESFCCPTCYKRFEDVESCKEHLIGEHEIESNLIYSCKQDECTYLTIKKEHWQNHMNARHPQLELSKEIKLEKKSYRCNVCGENFERNCKLKKHIAEKHEEMLGDIICSICCRRFRRKEGLTKHIRTHHFPEEYKCKHCDYTSFNITVYKKHVLDVHNDSRPYYCTFPGCEAQSSHCTFMKQHKASHESEKNYACEYCSKTFRSEIGVQTHQRDTCLNLRSYLCDTCGAKFNHLSSLRCHQRFHNNEKPFQCDSCPATFSSHQNLRRHKRIHSQVQPYNCPHCEKRFRHSNSLKAHLKSAHQIEVKFGTSVMDIPGVKADIWENQYKYKPRKKWEPIVNNEDNQSQRERSPPPIYRSKRQKISDQVAECYALNRKNSETNQEEASDRNETLDDLMKDVFGNIQQIENHTDNDKSMNEQNDVTENREVNQYPLLSGMDFQLDMS